MLGLASLPTAVSRLRAWRAEDATWWILRAAAGACFVGHGAFGLLTKPEWVPFFALVGISSDAAYALMPLVGAVDIAVGVAVLVRPSRVLLLYMTAWALWTAALRPLSGDSMFEFLERAGNYGVPLTMLLLLGRIGGWRDLVSAPTAPVRALGIPIGDVLSNPMYRNRETAEHAFGRATVDSTLGSEGSRTGTEAIAALRVLLGTPVPHGTNRAVVTRIGILTGAFEGQSVGQIQEGDCIVVRPRGDGGFRVLAHLSPGDWARLGVSQ